MYRNYSKKLLFLVHKELIISYKNFVQEGLENLNLNVKIQSQNLKFEFFDDIKKLKLKIGEIQKEENNIFDQINRSIKKFNNPNSEERNNNLKLRINKLRKKFEEINIDSNYLPYKFNQKLSEIDDRRKYNFSTFKTQINKWYFSDRKILNKIYPIVRKKTEEKFQDFISTLSSEIEIKFSRILGKLFSSYLEEERVLKSEILLMEKSNESFILDYKKYLRRADDIYLIKSPYFTVDSSKKNLEILETWKVEISRKYSLINRKIYDLREFYFSKVEEFLEVKKNETLKVKLKHQSSYSRIFNNLLIEQFNKKRGDGFKNYFSTIKKPGDLEDKELTFT